MDTDSVEKYSVTVKCTNCNYGHGKFTVNCWFEKGSLANLSIKTCEECHCQTLIRVY